MVTTWHICMRRELLLRTRSGLSLYKYRGFVTTYTLADWAQEASRIKGIVPPGPNWLDKIRFARVVCLEAKSPICI
jgi:hypothetical protein